MAPFQYQNSSSTPDANAATQGKEENLEGNLHLQSEMHPQSVNTKKVGTFLKATCMLGIHAMREGKQDRRAGHHNMPYASITCREGKQNRREGKPSC